MYRVAVMMSTYNGERFLKKQIESILVQNNVELTLYIRDDESSDSTIDIIKEYQKMNDNIILDAGKNIGVGNSFMQLLYTVGSNYDYYAFSDQDDVWLPDKLYKGIEMINSLNDPCCYCSNQLLIDKDGIPMGNRHIDSIPTSYLSILNNNHVTGCTMIWNAYLQNLLCEEKRRPSKELLHKRIHDVWVAMIASTIGTIVYDSDSYIEYRQHDNNVVGVKKTNILVEWKKKIKNPELRNGRSMLAQEVIEKYQDQFNDVSIKEFLDLYVNYRMSIPNKIELIKRGSIGMYSGETFWQIVAKVFLNLV